jgi:hypothetical protein
MDMSTDENTKLHKKKRRAWKRRDRPWYELQKVRKIPKTEWNRKDVEESRRLKRVEKRNAEQEIERQLDEDRQ